MASMAQFPVLLVGEPSTRLTTLLGPTDASAWAHDADRTTTSTQAHRTPDRSGRSRSAGPSAASRSQPRRLLAIVDDVEAAAAGLPRALRRLSRHGTRDPEVLVVAPALNSRLGFWCNDDREAIIAAGRRLDAVVLRLRFERVAVTGQVGDPDPLRAIEDALIAFDAEWLIIATSRPSASHWSERDLARRAERRFGRPVVHLTPGGAGHGRPVADRERVPS